MLNEIGYKDFDDLFKHIPAEAKVKGKLNLPEGKLYDLISIDFINSV